jgi:hypothetical protein
MSKSKIKLPTRHKANSDRKNQPQNIHFLIDQIPKVSYDEVYFSKYNEDHSYEDFIIYAEWLYDKGMKIPHLQKSLSKYKMSKHNCLIELIVFLEEKVLEDIVVIDVFNSHTVYDLNVSYLTENLDDNLKVGISKCINQIHCSENGGLFGYMEIDYVMGDLDTDEQETDYTIEDKANMKEIILQYDRLFDHFIIQNFDTDKTYEGYEKKIFDYVIKILDFDDKGVLGRNVFPAEDCEPFEQIFITAIYNDNEFSTNIFKECVQTRCQILGERETEFIGQLYKVEDGKIQGTVSDEEIKLLQEYENNINELCSLLKKETDED